MDGPATTRRAVLAGTAGALAAGTGCLGVSGARSDAVSILAAGSLANAVENGLRDAADHPVRAEARGSARAARLVASGAKDPDILSLADTALFDGLDADWYAEFATNELVLAYTTETSGGRRVAAADEWFRPLGRPDVSVGRTDPDLDPLGYRTLFALALATEHYGTDADLRTTVAADSRIYAETQLISRFETGAVDAAFAYRSMAVDRGYDYHALPDAVNLGTPAFADRYAEVAYDLPDGTVVRGAPISYGATIRRRSPAVREVFERHVAGDYLADFGFGVPANYPRYSAHAPVNIAE